MLLFLLAFFSVASARTVATFSRKIDTCDPKDRPFQEGVSKVVWSYNNKDPENNTLILQHNERGTAGIRFPLPNATTAHAPPDYFDVTTHDDVIKFDVLGNQSQYWCSAHHIRLPSKKHIVRFDPLLDPRNFKELHHISVYMCPVPFDESDYEFKGGCYTPGVPEKIQVCNTYTPLLFGWVAGGGTVILPDHVGSPVGSDIYLVLEVHYNNIAMRPIVDTSGIRFYYTEPTRPNEIGTFWGGQNTDPRFSIPAQQENYVLNTWIPSECTEKLFPPEGINLIWGLLHAHTAGVAINLTIIRNGTALPTLLNEPYYDFNFQDIAPLAGGKEFKLLPGDALNLICTYNTLGRDEPTRMGISTWEEMCLFYLTYYPRLSYESQYAFHANFTGIPNSPGKAMCMCSTEWMEMPPQYPMIYEPQIPECNMSTPPVELSTPRPLTDPLNFSQYDRMEYLDPEKKYKLYWSYDQQAQVVHGAVDVDTDGWVGFGLGQNGMAGADVFIAWSDKDGVPHFKDRFATMQALPPVDDSQDYYNIFVGEIHDPEPAPTEEEVVATSAKLNTRDKILIGVFVGVGVLSLVLFFDYRNRKQQKVSPSSTLQAEDFASKKMKDEEEGQVLKEKEETREKEKRDRQ